MFWGLKLDSGKVYQSTTSESFRVTAAVLDINSSNQQPVQVFLKHEDKDYPICTLCKEKGIYQVPLDLQFEKSEVISFYKTGAKCPVTLLGYEISDDDDFSFTSDVEEAESFTVSNEEPPKLIPIKRKVEEEPSPAKKKARLSIMKEDTKLSESSNKAKKDKTPQSSNKVSTPSPKQSNTKKEKSKVNKKDLSLSDLRNGDFGEEDSSDEDFEANKEDFDFDTTADSILKGSDDDDDIEEEYNEDDEEEEEDDDVDLDEDDDDDEDGEEEEDDDDEEDEDDDDDEEEEEEEEKMDVSLTEPKSKKSEKKSKAFTPLTMNGGTPKRNEKQQSVKTPVSQSKGNKENVKHLDTPMPQKKTPAKESPSQKKKFVKQGGITCEELVIGSGAEASPGASVYVYYEGRLRKTGKCFDKKLSGEPFDFKLGKAEVIKGWDVGVEGMKVGGKRRMTIPPHMAYGKKGVAPEIPPNSSLVFDVELKKVKK